MVMLSYLRVSTTVSSLGGDTVSTPLRDDSVASQGYPTYGLYMGVDRDLAIDEAIKTSVNQRGSIECVRSTPI